MRTIETALQQVKDFTKKHSNIRALILQGSLVNPNMKPDIFSDIDPLFYVDDLQSFIDDETWISNFGTPISRFSDSLPMNNKTVYTRLFIFEDGFKMDISFAHITLATYANTMPLYKVIIDKDNIVPLPEGIDDRKFFVKKPTKNKFLTVLHEFFFDTSYVIKSLKRDELFFTQHMFHVLSTKINDLCSWYAGVNHNWQVNVGLKGRYFKDVLDKETWLLLQKTFPANTIQSRYDALMAYFDLVHHTGTVIAKALECNYPLQEEQDMKQYCQTAFTYNMDKKV